MPAKMRAILFTLGSFLLTAAVVGHAYYQRKQFYPSVVFITKSNPSMAVSSSLVLLLIHYVFVWRSSSTHKTLLCFQVIYTQGFVLVLLLGKLMRKLFFGQLRAAEFEVRDECN
jgi:E3 ubiquitin-protein ligase synoviolin